MVMYIRPDANDPTPWEVWKTYRGETIERRPLPGTDDGHGRTRYEYRCFLSQGVFPVVYGLSQQCIRAQVARVKNKLYPYDCRICIHRYSETVLSPERCEYIGEQYRKVMDGMRWCAHFETRV